MTEQSLDLTSARSRRRWWFSAIGVLMAGLFFGASLTPSLIPRDPQVQGAIGGAVAAIGYLLGVFIGWLWAFLELPVPERGARRTINAVFIGLSATIALYCLWWAADWQNEIRAVMSLAPVETAHPFIVAAVALAVFVVLVLFGRLFARVMVLFGTWLGRILPRRIAAALGFVAAVWLFVTLLNGVLVQRIFEGIDASFELADSLIEPEFPRPTDPMKTGSEASLVDWQTMGRRGRSFVASAPTASEIEAFHGSPASDPVRVYVGRRSMDDPEARADLALRELIRVGGFDKSVLILAAPTGTGWMDPAGADPLDIMLAGDVATVAVQYSYLASFLALAVHPDYGLEQAEAVFDTIYDHWSTLPEDDRPALYINGLSQAAFNTQHAFPLLDILADPPAGALWVGSPFMSRLWAHARDNRVPGSPSWRPIFGNGSLVRVTNQENTLEEAPSPWGPVRLVFLHYGSDPIVVYTHDMFFRRPDWLDGQTPFDVSPQMPWFPVVTALQVAVDSTLALGNVGYGHDYAPEDYIDAWAALIAPEGWDEARSDRLKALFARDQAGG